MRTPAIAAISLLGLATVFGAGPSFRPDGRFTGSNLNGWHTLGNVEWRVQSGEIIGTPKDAGGGWLVLDRSSQDVGVYASFRCATGCRTGVLLRAESSAGGIKGVYVSLTDGDVASYRVPSFTTEVAVLRDVDGDGKPELVYAGEGSVRYAKPDAANPTGPWIVRTVSERGFATAHGIGVGDINGDGRMDIVNPYGWWEQPPSTGSGQAPGGAPPDPWPYHPQAFSRYGRNIHGGSVMAVYDANGDGLNDVVTVLNPHGWGLAWFEQKRDARGTIAFVQHMIMDDFSTKNAGGVTFSQPHGSTFGDVDGDKIPDFIVGKRYWAHRDDYLDPDPYGQPVLYWYRTVRNPKAPGGAEFVPELIHNRSGAGSDLLAMDLNNDGRLDIVTATRFGTFIFWGRK